ncbi:histidine kinase [candidate division KSB1 bacterium]|nr:histidine kinase [candidate division KSB1 bacterium]
MPSFKTKPLSWGRGLPVSLLAWTAYSMIYAAILSLQAGVVYVYALFGSLLSHYLMALYSVPVWFLITRVLANKRWPLHLLGHFVGALLYAYAWHASFLELFHRLFGEKVWQQAQLFVIKYWLIHEAIIVYAVFVGIFYVWRYQRQLREKEQREAELRLHANQMELAVLKAQLNPHFLFNTLNSINALVGSDPEAARQVLAQLAEVLRYSLESDRQPLAPLSEELRFVETYLAIEKARFGRRLQVKMEIDESARPLLVPPMILQPLAENAVKHGIAPKEEGGELTLRVQRRENHLAIEVLDNGAGAPAMLAANLLNNGRGLHNTDLRLRKMFGDEAGLQVSNGKDGFRVKFQVPVRVGLMD